MGAGALSALTPVSRRILLGNGIASLGSGLTFSFLVIYLGQVRGLGTALAGLLVAYMAILGLVCTLPVGTLVDRFGPRPILIIGVLILAVGNALLIFATSFGSAIVITTIISLGNAAFWAPQSALYARVTSSDRRQDVFGLQFMVINIGIGLGGLVAATIVDISDPQSFVLLYLLDAACNVFYALVLLTLRGVGVGPVETARVHKQQSGGYRLVLRDRALMSLAVASIVLLTFGYGSLDVGLPTYVTISGGLPVSIVAIGWAVNTAVIVVIQLFVLRVIRGRSRTRLGFVVALLWACAWLVIGLSIHFPSFVAAGLICLGTAIFGVGESIWSPVAPAIVNELATDELRGRYNAVIGWTWNISMAIGPALAGLMLGAELGPLWVAVVVLGCLVAGALLLRLRGRLTPSQDGRSVTPSPDVA